MHPIGELCAKWRSIATELREESNRIRRTVKQSTGAEERCNVRAEIYDKCADELEAAIRALPQSEIAGAGAAVANWPQDWPIEHTHQHICSNCHTSYWGWQESYQCYACFRRAAPAALPEGMKMAHKLRDETLCVKVINTERGNYWRCPVCDGENMHEVTCIIDRAATLLAAAHGTDK